ncbi:MAG: tRNA (adenosine(37)-N6)-threonylcarbamoyltransferase complex ATPase subunit type 1 TsaE [Candidatus Methylopumilus sp.]|nr:tRNA (adenosine(37)-N6)-threonylcarbamoyltransferase complex ATPase subunit type 1 TsaE [Candidatus Methylopumilus sp.]
MTHDITLKLADEQATLKLGADFARTLEVGVNVYLHGDLGAGKTTLVRGGLHGLGFIGKVKSPTYTLVEPYQVLNNKTIVNLYHFDLYRFMDEEEWDAAGFRDYFNPHSVCLIEWPDKAGSLIPQADIDVYLELNGEGRIARLVGNTRAGKACLERYQES